jgi:hypothetical protein
MPAKKKKAYLKNPLMSDSLSRPSEKDPEIADALSKVNVFELVT